MTYKISIIIPIYNAAEFIVNKTLKSIEKQTMDFENIEVILVNDCSSDNTEKVINEYAKIHKNIVPINLRENAGGPAIPRNIGITYASADYLMFLDQDDTFKKDACETLYNKIISEDVDLVCGNHNMVQNGRTTKCFNFDWATEEEIKIKDIHENPNFLTMGVAAWSKIFRKELVLKNNLKFTEGAGEDIFFSIRALLLAKGIILLKNFIVVDYQVRSESLSHQVNAEYIDEFTEFYLNFFDYCDKNIKDETLYNPLFNGRMNHILSILFYSDLYFDELSNVLRKIQTLFCKVNKKPFVFINKTFRLFLETLINDEYPFENSILVFSAIKTNRDKIDRIIKYLEHECKLYIDNGNGFNEGDSIRKKYRIYDINEIEFNLKEYKNIKRIRFDPISYFFINCNIINVTSNNGKISAKPVNSVTTKDKGDKFITADSQYSLQGNFKDIENIKIKFKIDLLNNYKIEKIFKNK